MLAMGSNSVANLGGGQCFLTVVPLLFAASRGLVVFAPEDGVDLHILVGALDVLATTQGALVGHARLLHDPGRGLVFSDTAGLDAVEVHPFEAVADHPPHGLGHEASSPVLA